MNSLADADANVEQVIDAVGTRFADTWEHEIGLMTLGEAEAAEDDEMLIEAGVQAD